MKTWLFLFLASISIALAGHARSEILRGSPEARAYENAAVDFYGLDRIEDDNGLRSAIRNGGLSCLPDGKYIRLHKRFPKEYAYCLPYVNEWLLSYGRQFRKNFRKPLIVSSAMRPNSYQERLALRNPNAAPTDGPFASTHSTGATIDIGYKGLKRKEVAWLEKTLSAMESRGEIQATKERYQACFHVMVYPPPKRLAKAEKNDATP
ncbi:MAG: hypothetical protein KBD19_01135 [Candidatus Moranbacteria bacterium]|nr:hypothetical protein [Candidatus Moranbacteria bacterium]